MKHIQKLSFEDSVESVGVWIDSRDLGWTGFVLTHGDKTCSGRSQLYDQYLHNHNSSIMQSPLAMTPYAEKAVATC